MSKINKFRSGFKDSNDVKKTLTKVFNLDKDNADNDISSYLYSDGLYLEFDCPVCFVDIQFTYDDCIDVLYNCQKEPITKRQLESGLVPCYQCWIKKTKAIVDKIEHEKQHRKKSMHQKRKEFIEKGICICGNQATLTKSKVFNLWFWDCNSCGIGIQASDEVQRRQN